ACRLKPRSATTRARESRLSGCLSRLRTLPRRRVSSRRLGWSDRDGPLGWGWSHSCDQAVWTEDDKVVYRAEDGREIEFCVGKSTLSAKSRHVAPSRSRRP